MNDIINIVSVIAAFGFGVVCLYLLMDTTIGRLKVFHSDSDLFGFQIKDLVFLVLAIVLLLSNFTFIRPL